MDQTKNAVLRCITEGVEATAGRSPTPRGTGRQQAEPSVVFITGIQ